MDVDDPAGNGNFYDEIDSFMPPPGDFNLDDIDEILRSTNHELDATLGFDAFEAPPASELFNFNIQNEFVPIHGTDGMVYGNGAAKTMPSHDTKPQLRNNSISSMDGENFNPDEFMNFLNDDSMKLEDFTAADSDYSNNSIDDAMQRQRNTPSPTGSCSSSCGSSTSGIQSDASSVGSLTPAYNHSQNEIKMTTLLESNFMEHEISGFKAPESVDAAINAASNLTTTIPLTPQIPQIIQVPVKTVPASTLNLTATKVATKQLNTAAPTNVKFVTPAAATAAAAAAAKITPPANAKPKTIFLSSNDFKTLMQRMNTNGTKAAGGGAKINGAINAQMPKIIMKTPNGKVITTNKIVQPLNVNSKTVMSKIVTANGAQLVLKQQAAAVAQATKSESNNSVGYYKGVIDEKLIKKQQRMIKNRESASLSRKKKKEYVVSLETRINNLEKENYCLKGENKSLRSQLVALAQTCRCKNGNVSEFILNSLNAAEQKSQPVKIAPKPAPKSLKQRMTAANIRKNVAVLFAMAFMVSLNVGNFQNFLNKNSLEAGMAEQTAEEPMPQVATAAGGRRLLWVETEAEYNEKLNRSKREAEAAVVMPPPPPLHFLKPINRTGGAGLSNTTTTTTTTTQNEMKHTPLGMNQTHNLRIASNLRKWIGGNANYLNLSLSEQYDKYDDDLENPTGFRATADYYDMKQYDLPLQQGNGPGGVNRQQQKRKLYVDDETMTSRSFGSNGKQRKLADDEMDNSLELFKPKISEEYLRLFRGIKRQDDTFYVLSFNMDHILLPAANYNKSARPKMALMLPAGDPAINGDVTLMQIDCEVTNTTELMLKAFMIPEKLRPSTYAKHENDVSSNDTAGSGNHAQQQKPNRENRFFRPAAAAAAATINEEATTETPKKTVADKIVAPKQKPVVRTFYLMGPKTQAAADAAKKKPTIIKLNGNETFVNGIMSVKNSTLYTKMRDTVNGNAITP